MILDLITSGLVAFTGFFLASLHRRVKRLEEINGWRY